MQTQAKEPENRQRRPARRKVKRTLLWKMVSFIVVFLILAVVLAMQVDRQYQLQREINALKEEINIIKGTNETYLTSLEFIDIAEVKSAANRVGLHAPQPNQLINLDFSQWAKTVDSIPIMKESDYVWKPSITPYRVEEGTASQIHAESASESSDVVATPSEITNEDENQPAITDSTRQIEGSLQRAQPAKTEKPISTTDLKTDEPSQTDVFDSISEEEGTAVNQTETIDQTDAFDMVQEESNEQTTSEE